MPEFERLQEINWSMQSTLRTGHANSEIQKNEEGSSEARECVTCEEAQPRWAWRLTTHRSSQVELLEELPQG